MTPLMGNVSWYVKDCTESAREQILSYSQTSANWENPLSRYNSLQIFVDLFLSCDIKSTKGFVAHRSVSNAVTFDIETLHSRDGSAKILECCPSKVNQTCSLPLLHPPYQLLSKFTACSWPWPRAYGSHCHSGRFFLPKFLAKSQWLVFTLKILLPYIPPPLWKGHWSPFRAMPMYFLILCWTQT